MVLPGAVFTLLAFVVALAVLVVVHELGHLVVAKLVGVKVERFSVGFGPIFYRRIWGETEYAISAIPLGGYVKMLGENEEDEEALANPERAFMTQPLGRRSAIVVAGPVTNLLFALVAYVGLALAYGIEVPSSLPVVGMVTPDSPAEAAGLISGDRVLSVDGETIASWEELANTVRGSGGRQLAVSIDRDGAPQTIDVTPRLEESLLRDPDGKGVYLMGVGPTYDHEALGVVAAVAHGARQTTGATLMVLKGFGWMITGRIPLKELGGPIAIAQVAGQQARQGAEAFVAMLAFLSINLGVLNLLPIPVLDGGHLALFAVEAVIRRPIRGRAREIAQSFGLIVLLGLMVVVFFNDVSRLIRG